MSSLNKVRLRDGTEVAISEWLHQPRFSVMEFNAADTVDLQVFNYVPGQPVSHGASVAARSAFFTDTNMVKRKAMNMDEALIVMAITYELFGLSTVTNGSGNNIALAPMVTSTDLKRLQFTGVWELYVGGIKKPAYRAPFEWIRQSIGSPAWVSGDAGNTVTRVDYGTGGRISAKNQELLKLPIYIGGFGQNARPGNSMNFYGRFFNAVGGAFTGLRGGIQMRWHLDGLGRRPA
jgi:hypothetical protein